MRILAEAFSASKSEFLYLLRFKFLLHIPEFGAIPYNIISYSAYYIV